jgi:hypothetical protein
VFLLAVQDTVLLAVFRSLSVNKDSPLDFSSCDNFPVCAPVRSRRQGLGTANLFSFLCMSCCLDAGHHQLRFSISIFVVDHSSSISARLFSAEPCFSLRFFGVGQIPCFSRSRPKCTWFSSSVFFFVHLSLRRVACLSAAATSVSSVPFRSAPPQCPPPAHFPLRM